MKKRKLAAATVVVLLLLQTVLVGCAANEPPVSTSFVVEDNQEKTSSDHLELNLNIPVLSGFDAAETINELISKNIAAARKEVEDAARFLGEDGSSIKAGLTVGYLYSKSGDVVSLWLMYANYTGGAHGLYWIEPYTFNTSTNEIYRFGDLFQEGSASGALVTERVLDKIRQNPDLYFTSAEETVKKYNNDFSFFINGNQVVVFFSLYELAPYAGGIQFFAFTAEELKDILKPEIFEAIKDAKPVNTEGTIMEY